MLYHWKLEKKHFIRDEKKTFYLKEKRSCTTVYDFVIQRTTTVTTWKWLTQIKLFQICHQSNLTWNQCYLIVIWKWNISSQNKNKLSDFKKQKWSTTMHHFHWNAITITITITITKPIHKQITHPQKEFLNLSSMQSHSE